MKIFCDSSDHDQFLTYLISCFCNQFIMMSDQLYMIHDQLHITSGKLEKWFVVLLTTNHKTVHTTDWWDWPQKPQDPWMVSFLSHLVKKLPKKVLHQSKAFDGFIRKILFLSIKITLMVFINEKCLFLFISFGLKLLLF